MDDLMKILAATLTGMSVDDSSAEVRSGWPRRKTRAGKKPYTELTDLPMQEVLKYLPSQWLQDLHRDGGGQDFVRQYAEATYAIPRAGRRLRGRDKVWATTRTANRS